MKNGLLKNVLRSAAAVAMLALVASPAAAQGIGIAGHASTLGVGGDLGIALSPVVSVRARASFQPWEPSRVVDDIDVTATLSSRTYAAFVDLHPFAGSFHISGGLVQFSAPITVVGQPLSSVEINGSMYEPDQVGRVEAIVRTKERAPYAGIGWGKAAGSFGMMLDLGVVFQGEPQLEVTVDGPFSSDPVFQQNLNAEVAEVENDISGFKYYPVISLGFSLGGF